MLRYLGTAAALALAASLATGAQAQERITYKSAKTGSSYYQMGVELAEAIKAGTDGDVSVTVEESQGSVQNVMEVRARGADYVFTTPPALVALAQEGKAMFEGKSAPQFDEIRALFPIPSLTMHFVVSNDSGVESLADLEGKTILLGSGSFGATEGAKYLEMFGLDGKVEISKAELSNAVAALKNGQIDAFVTAGSYPAPNVIEAAASTGVTVLSLSDEQVAETKRTRIVIPAGTYAGQDSDVVTTSLPVVAYATSAMSDDTAYLLAKTFWEQQEMLGGRVALVGRRDPGDALQHHHPDPSRSAALLRRDRRAPHRRAQVIDDRRPLRRGPPPTDPHDLNSLSPGVGRAGRRHRRGAPRPDLPRAGAEPRQPAAAYGTPAAVGVPAAGPHPVAGAHRRGDRRRRHRRAASGSRGTTPRSPNSTAIWRGARSWCWQPACCSSPWKGRGG